MILLLSTAALFAAMPLQADPCPVPSGQRTFAIEEYPDTVEPSGKGLWIAGKSFGPDEIASAAAGFDEHSGEPIIDLTLTANGQARFVEAQRCRVGSSIEISRDGKVLSRPYLNEPILGTGLRLSGVGNAEESQDFALQLTRSD